MNKRRDPGGWRKHPRPLPFLSDFQGSDTLHPRERRGSDMREKVKKVKLQWG